MYATQPKSGHQYQFTTHGQQDSITIRLVHKSIIKNLGSAIAGPTTMDLNTETKYSVTVTNYGGDSVLNGRLKVVKDKRVRFVAPPNTPILDTLTVFLPTIGPFSTDTISINIHAAESDPVKLGDTLHLQAWVEHGNDFDSTNNYASLLTQVTGIYTQPDTTKTTLQPPAGIQWIRFMEGKGEDFAYGITVLRGGGFAVCGLTTSKNGDFKMAIDSMGNAFVAAFNVDGSSRWTRVFTGSGFETFESIKEMKDGSLLIAGNSQSTNGDFEGAAAAGHIPLFRLNPDGSTRWRRFLGEPGTNTLFNMHTTQDGGALLAFQQSLSAGKKQNWLYKVDSTGALQWKKQVDSIMQRFDAAPAADGHIIVAGLYTVSRFGDAYKIFKYKADGTTVWEKTFRLFETVPTYFYFVNRVHIAEDYSIYLLGDAHYLPQDSLRGKGTGLHQLDDFALVKLDQEGNKLWQRFYGGNNREFPSSFSPTADGGFVITGYTLSRDGNISRPRGNKDGWLLKVDADGKLVWQRSIGGQWDDGLNDIVVASDNTIYAAGFSGSFNSGDIYKKTIGTDVMIVKIGMANFIEGTVFFDANSNSIKEADERLLSHLSVESDKGETGIATMSQDGYFTVSADTGRYITRPVLDDKYTTKPLADTVSFTDYNNRHVIHFAIQPKVLKKDLQVNLLPLGPVRPGFEVAYKIVFANKGSMAMTMDTVVLVKDKNQTLVNAIPQYSFFRNDTLTWIIPKLEPLDTASYIMVTLRNAAPPTLNNGDKVELMAAIAPIAGDATPDDNLSRLSQTVQGSFDPNDKSEKHNGRITQELLNKGTYLSYLIRFQNTGTDTAFTVVVRDTLDSRLNWNTFEMIDASHAYTLSRSGKNKLAWTFNHINLPDSNVNEKKSHGFIAYRIKPVDGLKVGDSIINTASIYFDFNLPIVTNRQNTTVSVDVLTSVPNVQPTESKISVFPNPTSDALWIHVNDQRSNTVTITLFDIAGKELWRKDYGKITTNRFEEQLSFKNRKKGIYMITVHIGAKAQTFKILVQ